MSAKQGRTIAIVGGTGTVGTPTVAALLEHGIHKITAISRTDSKATFPAGVNVVKGDYTDEAFLVSALKGHDVLMIALGVQVGHLQTPLIRAAAKAGVPWILPNEFGSDPQAERLVRESPVLGDKKGYRDLVEKVGLKWTAVVNNPWFDWSLGMGLWGIDIRKRTAKLYDGGAAPFVTTTVATTGRGIAGLLSLPDAEVAQYLNAPVYLHSFRLSQRDILDAVLRASGAEEKDWDVQTVDAAKEIETAWVSIRKGDFPGGIGAHYIPHMLEGRGGDYSAKWQDMSKLWVEPEDLDTVVKRVVQDVAVKSG